MTLISTSFFLFLICTLILYYCFPKYQKVVLLLASLFFYNSVSSEKIWLLLLVIFSSTYFSAIIIEKLKTVLWKRVTLCFAVGIIVFILFYFKYAHNLLSLLYSIFDIQGEISFVKLVSYIGVSYFSLSAIGYIIDVYWQSYKAEKNPVTVADFLFYFPQVISGPVTRFAEMKDYFRNQILFKSENIYYGIRRMLWGYFKKLVISERFAILTTTIYSNYTDFGAIDIVFGTLCYAVQLYTDFSGCMDIIIGASQLFGIKLPENFNAPFFSKNVRDFWHKWHITLGLWFKDYVMYPTQMSSFMVNLGKKLKNKFGKNISKKIPLYLSMSVLWFLIGIWHGGTGYYFIATGIVPFVLLILADLLNPATKTFLEKFNINSQNIFYRVFMSVKTVLLICICWIFVCSSSTKNSVAVINHAFHSLFKFNLVNNFEMFDIGYVSLYMMIIGLVVLFVSDYLQNKNSSIFKFNDKQLPIIKYSVIYAEILCIMIFGKIGSSQFIYLQF